MDKKMFAGVFAFLFAFMAVPFFVGAAIDVGNDAIARISLDGTSNFTVVDTNNPVSETGTLAKFTYFAQSTNRFRFVIVDSNSKVQWVSEEILPTDNGVNTYTPTAGVSVQAGWNIGVYFVNSGMIPFSLTGSTAKYTGSGNGVPYVNNVLQFDGYASRTYSFGAAGQALAATTTATGNATTTTEAGSATTADSGNTQINTVLANKKLCNTDGWRSIAGTSFMNQSQCISYYNQQILAYINTLIARLNEIKRQLQELIAQNRQNI